MADGRLSDNLEDINCELMKRVHLTTNNYQASSKITHHLISLSK